MSAIYKLKEWTQDTALSNFSSCLELQTFVCSDLRVLIYIYILSLSAAPWFHIPLVTPSISIQSIESCLQIRKENIYFPLPTFCLLVLNQIIQYEYVPSIVDLPFLNPVCVFGIMFFFPTSSNLILRICIPFVRSTQ